MNKFYQNYKDLFLSSKEPSLLNNLSDYHYKANYGKSFSKRYQYEKNINDINTIGSQFQRLFNQSSVGDSSYSRVNTEESPAGKQLKQIILPKLRVYDRQIQSKLKRFKTEEKHISYNQSLIGNKSSMHPSGIEMPCSNLEFGDQNFLKYKNRVKMFLLKNRINSSYQTQKSQKRVRIPLKSAGKPSIRHNQRSLFMNPQDQKYEYKTHENPIKLHFMNQNSQDFVIENFETEYQRNYSKKKIKSLQKQYNSVIKPLDIFEHQNNQVKNLNEQLQIQSFIKEKPYESKRNQIRFKSQHFTKQSKLNQSQNSNIKFSIHQKRKKQKSLKVPLPNKEQIKFSEYQNQFAFINKRLEHIQQFNNYYSHNCINSYKKAIVRRLNGKKQLQLRQNRLKYMLERQKLDYQN